MKKFLHRVADKLLEERLDAKRAVLIEGPVRQQQQNKRQKALYLWIDLI